MDKLFAEEKAPTKLAATTAIATARTKRSDNFKDGVSEELHEV